MPACDKRAPLPPCDRHTCRAEAEYRVFWPEMPPATLCSGHTLLWIGVGRKRGMRVTSVALGSVFENVLLWRMVEPARRH